MSKTPPRWTLLAAAVLLLACAVGCDARRPVRFVLPDSYVGWVRIDYGVPGAPELPVQDGRLLVLLPESGHLTTSSHMEYGSALDEYFVANPSGRTKALGPTGWGAGGTVWAGHNGTDEEGIVHQCFFVGSQEDYQEFQASRTSQEHPPIGPVTVASGP